MRVLLLIPLLLFISNVQAQTIILDSVKVRVAQDRYYTTLLEKFANSPKSLKKGETIDLYYGAPYVKKKQSVIDKNYIKCINGSKNTPSAKKLSFCKSALTNDPTNVELLFLVTSLGEDLVLDNASVFQEQLLTLTLCILFSGNGELEEAPFLVNSVGEGYLIADIQNVDIRSFKRTTKQLKDGFLDEFTKDGERFYFKTNINFDK